jgi:hypothetical protein
MLMGGVFWLKAVKTLHPTKIINRIYIYKSTSTPLFGSDGGCGANYCHLCWMLRPRYY